MDREEIIERLQDELRSADAAQDLYTNDKMTTDDKMMWQFYDGRISLLSELLVDLISASDGI
ncbi:hypothetical protein PANI_CDS0124 [Maribacter phage Panino]